jgi:undecaprenyl diphosphate synthase
MIMDGNGRWARRRGMPRIEGHRRGLAVIKDVIRTAREQKVRYLTLFAFSSENWKRPGPEVDFLMSSCESFLREELSMLTDAGIRFRHIGEKEGLTASLRDTLRWAEARTRAGKGMWVQLAFNYGGRQEILAAVRQIVEDVRSGRLDASQVTEEAIAARLYTAEAPDPDLIIRTSGEDRISNFLLWQAAYAEFYAVKKCWPDFRGRDLKKAIGDFKRRHRRFGGVDG